MIDIVVGVVLAKILELVPNKLVKKFLKSLYVNGLTYFKQNFLNEIELEDFVQNREIDVLKSINHSLSKLSSTELVLKNFSISEIIPQNINTSSFAVKY